MPEPIAEQIIVALLRSGTLSEEQALAIVERLEQDGEPDAAHQVRVSIIEAGAPNASEWEAGRRRSRFHIVPADGGNAID